MRTSCSPSDKNNAQPESEEKVNKKGSSRAGARSSISREIEAIAPSHNNGNSSRIVFDYGFEFEKLIVLWLPAQFERLS
jgi:hypothetical protein